MQRFDVNQDGHLDDDESATAYPVYKNLLSTFSKIKMDLVNRSAFFYMLKNGRIPCGFSDLAETLWKVMNHHELYISADRQRLGSVFGAIADSVHGQSNGQCGGQAKDKDKDSEDLNPPPDFRFQEGTKHP
jgi:hypothetical protein